MFLNIVPVYCVDTCGNYISYDQLFIYIVAPGVKYVKFLFVLLLTSTDCYFQAT